MFTEFIVKTEAGISLAGYHWERKRPGHVVCVIHGGESAA